MKKQIEKIKETTQGELCGILVGVGNIGIRDIELDSTITELLSANLSFPNKRVIVWVGIIIKVNDCYWKVINIDTPEDKLASITFEKVTSMDKKNVDIIIDDIDSQNETEQIIIDSNKLH